MRCHAQVSFRKASFVFQQMPTDESHFGGMLWKKNVYSACYIKSTWNGSVPIHANKFSSFFDFLSSQHHFLHIKNEWNVHIAPSHWQHILWKNKKGHTERIFTYEYFIWSIIAANVLGLKVIFPPVQIRLTIQFDDNHGVTVLWGHWIDAMRYNIFEHMLQSTYTCTKNVRLHIFRASGSYIRIRLTTTDSECYIADCCVNKQWEKNLSLQLVTKTKTDKEHRMPHCKPSTRDACDAYTTNEQSIFVQSTHNLCKIIVYSTTICFCTQVHFNWTAHVCGCESVFFTVVCTEGTTKTSDAIPLKRYIWYVYVRCTQVNNRAYVQHSACTCPVGTSVSVLIQRFIQLCVRSAIAVVVAIV